MKINFASKTIEITKTFADKASHFGSEEYHALRTAMCDLPDFEFAIKVTGCLPRSIIARYLPSEILCLIPGYSVALYSSFRAIAVKILLFYLLKTPKLALVVNW